MPDTSKETSSGSNGQSGLDAIGCSCGSCAMSHDHDAGHAHARDADNLTGAEPAAWLGIPRRTWLEGAAGVALFAAALLLPVAEWGRTALFAAAWLVFGREVLLGAVRGIRQGRWFDEFFLMTVASLGAFVIGEHPEAVAVMLFYRIGEAMQDAAVDRSKDSIRSLMAIRPDTALLVRGDEVVAVPPETVAVGDRFVVRPGMRVPVDGRVIAGQSDLDLSALTGESLPVSAEPGMEVLSGSIGTNGTLTLEAVRPYQESAVGRILALVETASSRKARAERFVTRFSRVYTPLVTGAAVLLAVLPPLLLPDASFRTWLYRALVFLVVSCPCALVVSIPLGFYGGIGGAARRGILVKGGQYLEALNHIDTVVFDKTGTLTEGRFRVASLHPADGSDDPENTLDLLRLAAIAEGQSTHPVAASIRAAFRHRAQGPVPTAERVREHAGNGVEVWHDGRHILCGKPGWLAASGVPMPEGALSGARHDRHPHHLSVHVALDGVHLGEIRLEDTPREGARQAVDALRSAGIRNIAMLTGDSRHAAGHVADRLGVAEVHAELLPHEKVERLETMIADGRRAAFVGDGINDAPVLVRADVGIAMGGIGSDAAMEAADIVLMRDDPGMVAEAIGIARRTRRIVVQNIVLALGVKGLVLVLGAFGLANMWEAVFADVGVALLAVMNATRVLRPARRGGP